jgi:hypothetical protein
LSKRGLLCSYYISILETLDRTPALIRRLKRRLGLRRDPRQMPPRTRVPIQQRRMRSDAIIPHDHRTRRPLHPSLEILALRDVVVQEVEQEVAFLFFVPHDATTELRVHEERLFAGRRMRANERMDGSYCVATDDAAPVLAVLGLFDG